MKTKLPVRVTVDFASVKDMWRAFDLGTRAERRAFRKHLRAIAGTQSVATTMNDIDVVMQVDKRAP